MEPLEKLDPAFRHKRPTAALFSALEFTLAQTMGGTFESFL